MRSVIVSIRHCVNKEARKTWIGKRRETGKTGTVQLGHTSAWSPADITQFKGLAR